MRIYGAGFAGLIAANMLRRYPLVVHEAQPELPHNHSALLRFRSDAVSVATGIPFKRVRVYKAVKTKHGLLTRSTLADGNKYALKVAGSVSARSILDLEPVDRYIAPENFTELLARGVPIEYEAPLVDVTELLPGDGPFISTIPMPRLMEAAGWYDEEGKSPDFFKARAIWTLTAEIERPSVDVYQTIYYPEPSVPMYRASLTGRRLTIEFAEQPGAKAVFDILVQVLEDDFGLRGVLANFDGEVKCQRYGKLMSMSEAEDLERRQFITQMSDRFNVYSLGRFATWRQILLDDIVADVRFIENFIHARSPYQRRIHELST